MEKPKTESQPKTLYKPHMTGEELTRELRKERRDKKFTIGVFIVGVIFAIILGELTFYSLYTNVVKPEQEQGEETLLAEDIQEEENIQFKPVEKIVYKKNENLYFFDPKQSREIQLTSDASDTTRYTSYAWKNRDEVTFAKCVQAGCYIQTYNHRELKTTDSFEIDAESVTAMRWSHKGDRIALLSQSNREAFLQIKDGDALNNIQTFQQGDDIVFDYDDALYLRFSRSDERIMIVNTFTFEGDASITVLSVNGESIATLKKTASSTPTFGNFGSEDTIYFKRGELLYVRSLSTGDEAVVTDRITDGYGFTLSPDRTQFTYWTHDWMSGISTIWTYEIGTGKIGRLKDQASQPMWLNNDELIYSGVENCIQCNREELEYTGMFSFELKTKKSTTLFETDSDLSASSDNL